MAGGSPAATLIAQLSSDSAIARESAIARLTVIGARAVGPLMEFATSAAPPTARTAALVALERIGDRRALRAAVPLTKDADVDVALAAIAVAAAFVRDRRGVEAVDALTAVAVDRGRPASVRAAAAHALRPLGPATIAPLTRQLSNDPALKYAEPAAMRTRIAAAARAPLTALLALVEEIRERERTAPRGEREQWTEIRGEAHALLARRGSTIALYDLRETIEAAGGPLPVGFVAAAAEIGDASCLEPIAAAYAAAGDLYWKKALADAFRAIRKRGRISRRHAAIRRIEARWPAAAKGLGISGAGRSRG